MTDLSFAGYLQPLEVPPDPVGDDWRGLTGPQGPPGEASLASVLASGSTTARSAAARAADVANVLDYGAGQGGDDAAAIRAAIASGKKVILIPPGTYTMRSTVPPWGHAAAPRHLQFLGLSGVCVIAYGATLQVADSLAPVATTLISFEGNCKHCAWFGGTLVGNPTGGPGVENVGINFVSVTDMTVRDVRFTGEFLTSMTGVWIFDARFENLVGVNNANSIDMAHLENVRWLGCAFYAAPTSPVAGANIHYDVNTLMDNAVTDAAGAARALVGGNTNNVRFIDCLFDGFNNGIAVDAVNGMLISRTTIRNGLKASSAVGQAGVLLIRGALAITAGLPTTDITVDDCDIFNNGVTAGGGVGCGVYITAASGNVTQVAIVNSRIYDNTDAGIDSAGATTVLGLWVSGCDFRSRTGSTVQAAAVGGLLGGLVNVGGSAYVAARNNLGLVAQGLDYLMVEGSSQNGVADADTKINVLRLTSNNASAGAGGGIEFGGRRAASGAGAPASGYFASLKGALVNGNDNTTGALDVYFRMAATDISLTKVGGFTTTGLNAMAVGATTPASGDFTTLSASSTITGAGFTAWAASPPAIGGTAPAAGTFTTLAANTLSALVGATVGANAAAGVYFHINGAVATARVLQFETAGSARWIVQSDNGAESGSNAGSTFRIQAMADNGALLFAGLTIARATGLVSLPKGAAISGGSSTIDGAVIGGATPAAASVTQLNLTTSAGPNLRSGTGAASGTQPKGSIWMRTDGAAGSTMYVSQGGGTWNAVAGV